MKKYSLGVISGIMTVIIFILLVGTANSQEDSISVYLERLELLIREELVKSTTSGRFQLQSFSIDRTHWHYMLDTTTGELYRMEVGRNPENSKWISISGSIFDQEDQ